MRTSSIRFKFLLNMPVVLRAAAIVLFIALLAGGIALGVRSCSPKSSGVADGGMVIQGASPTAAYHAVKGAVIAFDGSYARAYDLKKGELIWERSPDGSQGYQCASSNDLIALYKANSLCVYAPDGSVAFSVTTEQVISEVAVGVSRVAIRYQDDSIEIIDSTGKSVEVIVSTEGQVMDFGLYSSSDLMWVLLLDEEGIQPKSVLNIYQPGKLLIAGYSTQDQLYYRPQMSGNSIYIVGTRTVDIRNTVDMSESSVLVYGWTLRDAYAGDSMNLLFSLTEQGDAATSLRVVSEDKSADLRMHAGCTDLLMGANSVYGFAGQTLYSVPLNRGRTVSYSLPYAVDGVLCRLSDNRVLLSGEGAVHLVTLP